MFLFIIPIPTLSFTSKLPLNKMTPASFIPAWFTTKVTPTPWVFIHTFLPATSKQDHNDHAPYKQIYNTNNNEYTDKTDKDNHDAYMDKTNNNPTAYYNPYCSSAP